MFHVPHFCPDWSQNPYKLKDNGQTSKCKIRLRFFAAIG
ncbi:MAG: hypothetical protein USCAAHI_02777 [Beijerinckiaceae bacterium]|nr:MAG: hypothetical protein USCAAHI_02777 [Beijerinckiaceae bacterium]